MAPKNSKNVSELSSVEPEPSVTTDAKVLVDDSTNDSTKNEPQHSSKDSLKDPKDSTSNPKDFTGKEGLEDIKDAESNSKGSRDATKQNSPEGSAPNQPSNGSKPVSSAEEKPQQPPRPPPRPQIERKPSAFTSNLGELKEAFPDSKENMLRAILVAASNNLEAAFTGMLALSDETIRPALYIREQIEMDERLARRLAEKQQPRRKFRASRTYDYYDERQGSSAGRQRYSGERNPDSDNFGGDDLYEGLQKGYNETKQAVSSVWGSIKQRLNGELNDEDPEAVYTRGGREPLRSQWWPRQPNVEQRTLVSTDLEPAEGPKLPPRKPSRPTTKDSVGEGRSVNAFGDEIDVSKTEDQEPDAFFIGESDDDLGSLNLSDHDPEPKDQKDENLNTSDLTDSKVENDSTNEIKDARKEIKDGKSAKDLLNKVKSGQ